MNTKLSVALLSGLSLVLSVGAVAVSGDDSGDYINWSYAMGNSSETEPSLYPTQRSDDYALTEDHPIHSLAQASKATPITCTNGCPGRPDPESPSLVPDSLLVTYEDEAAPVADFADTDFDLDDPFKSVAAVAVRDKNKNGNNGSVDQSADYRQITIDHSYETLTSPTANTGNVFSGAQYGQSEMGSFQPDSQFIQTIPTQSSVQYPVTRQYPVSVEYPLMVQRNMTVEQPVIMQQPVIVRRPVVVQQDITIQRQPAVLQQQPVVMQQQPTYVQQQPVLFQAPAGAIDYSVLSGINGLSAPQPIFQPQIQQIQAQPVQEPQQLVPAQVQTQPTFQAQPTFQPQAQPVFQPQVMAQPTTSYTPMYIQLPQQPATMMPSQPLYVPMGQPQQYQVQGQIQAQPIYMVPQSTPFSGMQMPAQQPIYSQQSY